jgi:Kef-type K+ transport system membrane component KefB
VQAVGLVVVVSLIGTRLMRRWSSLLDVPMNPLSPLTISLALCLGLAASASFLGLAAIIGAFLAGMVLAEAKQRHTLERQIQPIMILLVPFFFVVTGAKVDLGQLGSLEALGILLVVTVLAVLSKLIGCGMGAWSLKKRSALIVGIGMVPRGEVGIIVASLGLQAGIFSGRIYAVIITMSLITSILAPPILKSLLAHPDAEAPPPEILPSEEDEESHLYSVEETGHDR